MAQQSGQKRKLFKIILKTALIQAKYERRKIFLIISCLTGQFVLKHLLGGLEWILRKIRKREQ